LDNHLDLQLLKLRTEHLLPRLGDHHRKAGGGGGWEKWNPRGGGESVKIWDQIGDSRLIGEGCGRRLVGWFSMFISVSWSLV
jgi:hypothetical protein